MSKITAYSQLAATAAAYGDMVPIVDVDNTTMAPSGTTMKIAIGDLVLAITGFVGQTASGHPTSGTFAVGNWVVDETGSFWVCTAAGAPGTWVQVAADPNYVPADFGYLAWNFWLGETGGSGSALATAGQIYLIKVPVRAPLSVTGIRLNLGTAGATLTTGQNFTGLYSSTGSLIGTTADQTTNWTGATGNIDANLASGPFTVNPPFAWVPLLFNGTTGPAFTHGASLNNSVANGKNAVSTANYGTILTGQTSLPASITPANIAFASTTYGVALF